MVFPPTSTLQKSGMRYNVQTINGPTLQVNVVIPRRTRLSLQQNPRLRGDNTVKGNGRPVKAKKSQVYNVQTIDNPTL